MRNHPILITKTNNMSDLKMNGKITNILEVEKGTSKAGKDWQKLSFVIDNGDTYNPTVCFSIFGSEKVENFNKYNKVGDDVEVSFNVSSREFSGKYYHNLDAWKVFKSTGETKQEVVEENDDSGLPF